MSPPSVAKSGRKSVATKTSSAESATSKRSYGSNAIYLDDIVLYAKPRERDSITPSQENASLLTTTSGTPVDDDTNETIKLDQVQETMTTRPPTHNVPTPETTADMSFTETTPGASTEEPTADISFELEVSVSEWRSDGVGNGGNICHRKVIREFDLDDLDDFEALFESVMNQSNFDGKRFANTDVTEQLRNRFDLAAGYYREKAVDFLLGDPELFKEDLLPAHVQSQALLWLRYATALRQIEKCLWYKEVVDLGLRGLSVGLDGDEN
ncbi:hypothetical protein QFC22_004986 [Naganishia vaughanmartiniae]|uniref:Uncharacterized protein n=1 Tax=Naganishia vaughanmartiniae TaxID=1424756 RepID=A0ACC2WXI8_9TREE|nr:hypothetical protein QFC22_004986 [Naganishia vaughanmartiniae]